MLCLTAILTNSNHQHNGTEGTKKMIRIRILYETGASIILKLPLPCNFFCHPTPFIVPNKCITLINTNFKWASLACFGTSVPSSGRTKCQFLKPNSTVKLLFIGTWSVAALSLASCIKRKTLQNILKPLSYCCKFCVFMLLVGTFHFNIYLFRC